MNSTYGFIIKPQESKEDFKERVEKEWVKVLAQAQKNEEFQKIKKAYLEEIQKLSVQKDQVKIEDVASLLRKSPLCQTLTGIEGIKRVIERDMKELVENKFTPKEIVEALFKDGSLKVKKVPVHNLQLYLIKADQETPQAFEARFNKSWLRLKKTYFKLAVEDFAEQEQHKIPQERMGKKQIKENLQSLWDNDSVLEL